MTIYEFTRAYKEDPSICSLPNQSQTSCFVLEINGPVDIKSQNTDSLRDGDYPKCKEIVPFLSLYVETERMRD